MVEYESLRARGWSDTIRAVKSFPGLLVEIGGTAVTHHWDHVTVGNLNSNTGENEYTAKEFLEGNHYQPAKDALLMLLDGLN